MNNTGNSTISSDFLRVLMALKKNTMRDNNVAEVAKVLNTDTMTCSLLSNSNAFIQCEKLQDLGVKVGDIVLIIFTNSDFRQNLTRLKNNQPTVNTEVKDLHSLNYGVIVGLIYRQNNSEE